MTASTHCLVSALVVLISVPVGVSTLDSTSITIGSSLTSSLESLGKQAQLSELEAVATAIRAISGGVNLSVGALGSNQSVLVEASVVVEVVGLLSAILGESLTFSFVKDGPTTTIVESLKFPGTRSSDITRRTSDDGVGGDELSLVVVVGPLRSSTNATRTAGVDCTLDIIEQLEEVLISSKIAGDSTILTLVPRTRLLYWMAIEELTFII